MQSEDRMQTRTLNKYNCFFVCVFCLYLFSSFLFACLFVLEKTVGTEDTVQILNLLPESHSPNIPCNDL